MKNTPLSCLRQHFLIAMPQMDDPYFAHSLIFLIQHDDQGSMGLVVNKPTGLSLSDILSQLKPELAQTPAAHKHGIYQGGPVETERGLILHPKGQTYANTLDLGEFSLTSSQDILYAIAQGEGPAHNIITLGYAGWSPQQLEAEIAANCWLVGEADINQILFHTPNDQRRQQAAKSMGVDLAFLSAEVGHA